MTYLIQIDGKPTTTSANGQGSITLNWSPSLMGGTFQFTRSLYGMGEYDDGFIVQPAGTVGRAFTIRRAIPTAASPSRGREVSTDAANEADRQQRFLYQLFLHQLHRQQSLCDELHGGRIGNLVRDSYTNIYSTNVAFTLEIQDVLQGVSYYLPLYGATSNVLTIQSNGVSGTSIFQQQGPVVEIPTSITLPSPFSFISGETSFFNFLNYFTNFPCQGNFSGPLQYATNVNGTVTNVTATETSYICINVETNEVIPSAVDGLDYSSADSTNLTFDDFQMSQDVYLTLPSLTFNSGFLGGEGGPDYPDIFGNFTYFWGQREHCLEFDSSAESGDPAGSAGEPGYCPACHLSIPGVNDRGSGEHGVH